MRESYVKRLRVLLETEVDEAEAIVAAKGFSGQLQQMIEKVGRLQNEDLPPATDKMRDTYGVPAAAAFQQSTSASLQTVLDSLYTAKDGLDQAVVKMGTGAVPGMGEVDMDVDIGMNPEMDMEMDPELGMDPSMDPGMDPAMGDELAGSPEIAGELDAELDNIEDEFGGDEAMAGPEDEPLGRAKKESLRHIAKQIREMQNRIDNTRRLQESKKLKKAKGTNS